MSTYEITAGELLYLLNAAGVQRPLTMAVEEFALPEGTEAVEPRADADTLRALVEFLAAPEVVVRVWRQDGTGAPTNKWYYWGGDSAVGVQQTESNTFELFEVSGRQILLDAAQAALDLRPVPDDLDFYVILQREDFLAVRDLANVWGEVPALEILEADGLDKLAAIELFDVACEPEWRAQVNLSGIRQEGNIERVLRVAQGPNSAWMALPVDENVQAVRVETVQAGEIAAMLGAYWDEVAT